MIDKRNQEQRKYYVQPYQIVLFYIKLLQQIHV